MSSNIVKEAEKEKCNVCNYENMHHSLCPNNIINSDTYGYQHEQQSS
jgi:hypothetical protein